MVDPALLFGIGLAIVVLVLIPGLAITEWMESKERRKNQPLSSPEEKQNHRAQLMYVLYQATNGNPRWEVNVWALKEQVGWPTLVMADVCDFLAEAGLVKIRNLAPTDLPERYLAKLMKRQNIGLTAAGVLEVEAALEAPHEPTTHLPPINNVFHGSVGSVQQQIGTSNSPMVGPRSVSILDQRQVINHYLQVYREVLEHLSPPRRAIVLAELATAEAQLKSPKPNEGVLREALRSLRSIAEGMAGNAAFMSIVELGRHLHL